MTRHLQRLVSAMHRSHGASNNRLIDLATTMQRRNGITSSGAPLREVELRAFAYWLDEIEHEYDILCEQKPDSAPKRLDYVKDRIQTLTGWKHASYYNHLRELKQWRAEGFL
ncbi:MAG: hypothetical protein EA401_08465 [Planctomycetota bacterium]|nr:MAG: hypothetical protein EA401_08465 [Planctomycetota bacterium]